MSIPIVLIRVPQKNKTYIYIYIYLFRRRSYMYMYEEIYYRSWRAWLWKPRRSMICCLQAGEPGKSVA